MFDILQLNDMLVPQLKELATTISVNKYEIATNMALTYPILLINPANSLNLIFKGLSCHFSCNSLLIFP